MGKYIDKDVLLAEIEKLKEIYSRLLTRNNYEDGLQEGRLIGYEDVLNEINTLETKEVDLEKKVDLEKELDLMITSAHIFHQELPSLLDVAKHFFKLGLKAQKGE